MADLMIGKRYVGDAHPPYVIAEIGANHNGDMDLCRRMIDSAVDCGADAVKFQSWSKTSIASRGEYERNVEYSDKKRHFGSLEEMAERYQFTAEMHFEARDYCREKGVDFLSTAFTREEVDLLESLEVSAHKVASMDITHHTLLEYLAKTRKPLIVSTGMASLAEIDEALDVLRTNNAGPIILLHCVSIYPPAYEDIRLRNVPMLRETFELPVGFSDHTIGTAIPLASIALGACIIEKHFTLDKDLDGWDHWISADPDELRVICQEGRNVHQALGGSRRIVSAAELEKRRAFRRAIVIRDALSEGTVLERAHLDFKRPGTGIQPTEMQYVIGRKLRRDTKPDHELQWSDLF